MDPEIWNSSVGYYGYGTYELDYEWMNDYELENYPNQSSESVQSF